MSRDEVVLAQMEAHRTIRKYSGEPVPDEHVRAAVRAAQRAATSSNVQAYCLLRVRDPATRERLAELCGGQAQVARAGAFFAVCGDLRRHWLVAEDAETPHVDNLESFLVAAIDASLFAQNLVLAFESQGYGTCYIGGLRTRLPEADALLELPRGVLPFYGLCVGIADEEPQPRPRLPLEAVLLEERYPSDEELRAHIAAYDALSAEYYERRGQSGHDWSGGVARRHAVALREHLREFYTGKGAVLD